MSGNSWETEGEHGTKHLQYLLLWFQGEKKKKKERKKKRTKSNTYCSAEARKWNSYKRVSENADTHPKSSIIYLI